MSTMMDSVAGKGQNLSTVLGLDPVLSLIFGANTCTRTPRPASVVPVPRPPTCR
jgi:hypothetical protein